MRRLRMRILMKSMWKAKRMWVTVASVTWSDELVSATVVNTGNINSENERIMKPQVVLDYNEGRQGADLSDKLSTYYTCLRRSIKWYRKVAFELVFGTALANSYLIYKEHYAANKITILQFRESLVRSLLLGMSFEKLKPVWNRNRLSKQNVSLLITSSKKKKVLLAMFEDAVLAATRQLGSTNQEKQAWQQQKK